MPRYDSDNYSDPRKRSRSRSRSRSRDRGYDDRKRRRDYSPDEDRERSRYPRSDSERYEKRERTEAAPGNDSGSKDSTGAQVKAMVTEENGEISCSIEETNRIRALLGMKPLNMEKTNKEQKAVDNFRDRQENERKEREAKELRERLEKAKEKRLLKDQLTGGTLGDTSIAEQDGVLSAADWVKRSRKREKEVADEKEKARLMAEMAAKRLQEEEEEMLRSGYGAADLTGLKVQHSAKDFEVGQEVVLTLADSNILDTDDQGRVLGLKEEADVLENVNFADEEKRLEREKRAKRAKQPVYSGYDDAEFEEGLAPGSRPSILSHYDKEKKTGPRLVLGSGGVAMDVDASSAVKEETKKALPQSLQVETKDASDFYTKAEYTAFNKPKEKKKKKLRKREKEDLGDLEGILGDSMEGEGAHADRGSRASRGGASDAAAVASMEAKKRDDYENAVRAAEEKSRASQFASSSSVSASVAPVWSGTDGRSAAEFAEVEDDAELAQSLARARRLALTKQPKENEQSDATEDVVAGRVKELLTKAQDVAVRNGYKITFVNGGVCESKEGESNPLGEEIDAEGRRADGVLVFTDTTEFTSRLQARLTEKARARAEAAVRAAASSEQLQQLEIQREEGFESMRGKSSSSARGSGGGSEGDGGSDQGDEWAGIDIEGQNEEEEEEEEGEGEDDQMAFLHRQPLVNSGMAATLQLLRGSGELGKREELAGRAKDDRSSDPSAGPDGIKLEYRDEFGRKLTQKEAFRQLCYKFHGYGAGKKKTEKRLQALQEQNKSMSSRDALDAGTMRSLLRAQEATGKAHLTIQGGSAGVAGGMSAAELLAMRNKKSGGTSSMISKAGSTKSSK